MANMTNESPKSRLIAIFFCMFFGWAGLHRFYVRKIGTGFLMLFTMGGFGMWYMFDLLMVALGAFRDYDGLRVTKW